MLSQTTPSALTRRSERAPCYGRILAAYQVVQSSPNATYWGGRSNYTIHRSSSGRASWEFVNRVYADGAGYSDAIVLPDPEDPNSRVLAMAFQETFHPPQHGIEGGGYDIGLALLPLKHDDEAWCSVATGHCDM